MPSKQLTRLICLCLAPILTISGMVNAGRADALTAPRTQIVTSANDGGAGSLQQAIADTIPALSANLLFDSEQEVVAPDGLGDDQFGYSVTVSGDTALIGADGNNAYQGSAYIFTRSGETWTFAAKLNASDAAANNWFGTSVALSGDTAIVGAPGGFSSPTQGAAYVFVKPAGGWTSTTETAKLMASNGTAGDAFGWSVAISDGTALIGAYGADSYKGAAYIFLKPVTGWATTSAFDAQLTNSEASVNDHFGQAVVLSQDTVVVTAVGVSSFSGAAYVFTKPADGWKTSSAYSAKLTATDTTQNDEFGWSAAAYDDTILIGAMGNNDAQGAAYIFTEPISSWNSLAGSAATETVKLTAPAGSPYEYMGVSVALWGETAVIGAPMATIGDQPYQQGAAYVFERPASGWGGATVNSVLTSTDGAGSDYFGWSMGTLHGHTISGCERVNPPVPIYTRAPRISINGKATP